MNQNLEQFVGHHVTRHLGRIRKICEPLKLCFGINYFCYFTIKPNGQWLPMANRPDWIEYYTENKMYLADPFQIHPRYFKTGTYLWANQFSDKGQQKILKDALDANDMAHGIMFMEKHGDHCEGFGFTTAAQNTSIYSTYLNQGHLLRKFCRYFKQEMTPFIKQAQYSPVDLLALKQQGFNDLPQNPFDPDLLKANKFLKFIQKKSGIDLTKREKECLSYYLDDHLMRDVAEHMGLKVRTVEFYLSNIKDKLSCQNKTQLLKKAQELRLMGEID